MDRNLRELINELKVHLCEDCQFTIDEICEVANNLDGITEVLDEDSVYYNFEIEDDY